MNKKVLNYQVVVTPDEYPDGKPCYNVYCPTLNISDYGNTIDEALSSMREAIELWVDTLAENKELIPADKSGMLMTTLDIPINRPFQFA
jgi:predicted RNase H-like HicB family nuclease